MNHDLAESIFVEIRNRPYAWACKEGVAANNCYYKGIELLRRLGEAGYAVRGRVGETCLDSKIPERIRELYPDEFKLTHFFVEAHIDDKWRVLDPSFDPPLKRHGFIVNDWGSNRTCFEITQLYSQEEQIVYQQEWFSHEYASRYFDKIFPCARALNEYLERLRLNKEIASP